MKFNMTSKAAHASSQIKFSQSKKRNFDQVHEIALKRLSPLNNSLHRTSGTSLPCSLSTTSMKMCSTHKSDLLLQAAKKQTKICTNLYSLNIIHYSVLLK